MELIVDTKLDKVKLTLWIIHKASNGLQKFPKVRSLR